MSERAGYWEELERPGPDAVTIGEAELRRGSRVRLRPRAGGDVWDLVLAGRTAVIEGIEERTDGELQVAVTIDDDPGRDLGLERQPGHRFFFSVEELEPIADAEPRPEGPRVLVAGVGNVFCGDDGFGVALADRLARIELPTGVEVVDFGIRGMDLAYALHDGYDAAVMLDAMPRGGRPGTLYVIEPELEEGGAVSIDTHGMDPAKVLALARGLSDEPLPRIVILGCEPQVWPSPDEETVIAQLSEPVRQALDEAVRMAENLLMDLTQPEQEVRRR